jgi:hypothetical protein
MTEPESHTLAYLRRIDEKLDRIEGRMNGGGNSARPDRGRAAGAQRHRAAPGGREIETTGLKAMLDRHERWLGDLGRRVGELEGAPKE